MKQVNREIRMHRKEADDDRRSKMQFKAFVVHLILNGNVEEAVGRLAKHYNVEPPRVKVGLPVRHSAKALGCYAAKYKTIYVLNSDVLKDPFVILHEFYHHLRTSIDRKHRGTEKYASQFARDFVLEGQGRQTSLE